MFPFFHEDTNIGRCIKVKDHCKFCVKANLCSDVEKCTNMANRSIYEYVAHSFLFFFHLTFTFQMATIIQVETISVCSDFGDEMTSYSQKNDVGLENQNEQSIGVASVMQQTVTEKELMDARLLIRAMEAEHIQLLKELKHLQEENRKYMGVISNEEKMQSDSVHKLKMHCLGSDNLSSKKEGRVMESDHIAPKNLQEKLGRLTKDLENARLLNCQYQQVQASQLSCQHEADLVREQVEMETARTILHLQEEVTALQLELNQRLASVTEENTRLRDSITAKEEEVKSICVDWERATLELTSFLLDGSKSLKDASRQIENIACSFPQINVWVGENVERAARVCIDKEERILLLQRSLEDAQRMIVEMEMKLSSLKGATIAFNEFQEPSGDVKTDEAARLSILFNDKTDLVKVLTTELKLKEDQLIMAEKRADSAFLIVKWLVDCNKAAYGDHTEVDIPISSIATSKGMQSGVMAGIMERIEFLTTDNLDTQMELAKLVLLECENVINTSQEDAEVHLSTLQKDIFEACSVYKELIQDLQREVLDMRSKFFELKENCKNPQISTTNLPSVGAAESLKCHLLHQVKGELAQANDILKLIKDCFKTKATLHVQLPNDEDAIENDSWSSNSSTSSSDFSIESFATGNNLSGSHCSRKTTELTYDKKFEEVSAQSDLESSEKLGLFGLRKELRKALYVFDKLDVWLTTILDESDIGECSHTKGTNFRGFYVCKRKTT